MGKLIIVILLFCPIILRGQQINWKTISDVQKRIKSESINNKVFYSQFDWYSPREVDSLQSRYFKYTKKKPLIYGVDFYYATGTWFTERSKILYRNNLISIIRSAWERDKAIPCFSWHLENPYIPSGTELYMGCRYRTGYPGYPEQHKNIIKEILDDKGEACGLGNYSGKDNKIIYSNPRKWFEARCKEVADIINELTDKKGKRIPIIIRLWHECEDDWMWWGASSCSIEEYKNFFILTQKLIKKHLKRKQILWAYCTDQYFSSENEYLRRYPGNRYVDILGYDDYSIAKPDKLDLCIKRAQCISNLSHKYNKISAIFETSNNYKITKEYFFRNCISKVIIADRVNLGIFQMWTSDNFNTIEEIGDRKWFLEQPYIIVKE